MRKLFIFISLILISLCSFSQTWAWSTLNSNTTANLKSIYFIGNFGSYGWAVGANGNVSKTTNGTNWNTPTYPVSTQLNSIYINNNFGCIVGDGGVILKTNNTGTTWVGVASGTTQNLNHIFFINNGLPIGGNIYAFAVGEFGTIVKIVISSGNLWTVTATTYGSNNFKSVYFTDANFGYIATGYNNIRGYIIKTTNGGASWISPVGHEIGTKNLNSIYFTDANTGYAVGNSGVYTKTTDAGANWVTPISLTSNDLNYIYFIDANNGYAVGNASTILKTTNAGANWVAETCPITNVNLNSVTYSTNWFICGDNGTILKYTNNVFISENISTDFNVYPNPVKSGNRITVEGDNIQNITMINIKGEQIISTNIKEIETSGLKPGLYILRIQSDSGQTIKKIVIQ